MKYRIVAHDARNWRIQEWTEGGTAFGHTGKPRWVGLERYYPTLRGAARELLDLAARNALLVGEAQSIQEALRVAEARVLAALEGLPEGAPGG